MVTLYDMYKFTCNVVDAGSIIDIQEQARTMKANLIDDIKSQKNRDMKPVVNPIRIVSLVCKTAAEENKGLSVFRNRFYLSNGEICVKSTFHPKIPLDHSHRDLHSLFTVNRDELYKVQLPPYFELCTKLHECKRGDLYYTFECGNNYYTYPAVYLLWAIVATGKIFGYISQSGSLFKPLYVMNKDTKVYIPEVLIDHDYLGYFNEPMSAKYRLKVMLSENEIKFGIKDL